MTAKDPDDSGAPPFLSFREAVLDYHGPADDLTNLTEIRIGWFGPTNEDDPLTGDLWWAAKLAVDEANGRLGSRHKPAFAGQPRPFAALPFRLVPRWARDPWGTGVSQLIRMVYEEQPLALLGSMDSASTHLAEQVVAKTQLPLVSPIATDKSVTLAGVAWMFACAPTDAAIARVLVDDLVATLNATAARKDGAAEIRLTLLAGTDHESRMMTREVIRELSRRGRLPDFRLEVSPGVADISRQLAHLRDFRPGILLIVAGAEDAALLVRAVRGMAAGVSAFPAPAKPPDIETGSEMRRLEPVIFGSHTLGRVRFRELAGTAAEGVRFPLLWTPEAADTNAVRFLDRFKTERAHAPDYAAALTYDATRLLLEAIRLSGPNRARVREALVRLSPWPGIAGPICFDGTGQNTRTNLAMGTIRNGTVTPLASVPNVAGRGDVQPQP